MARSIALAPSIPLSPQRQTSHTLQLINPALLTPSELSLAIYGDPTVGIEDLQASIQENGILVPLVVIPQEEQGRWTILSGSRRWRCALSTGLAEVPCEVHNTYSSAAQRRIILEYNRQRRKSFSQLMREADVLEELLKGNARQRSLSISTSSRQDVLRLSRIYMAPIVGIPTPFQVCILGLLEPSLKRS